MTTREMLRIGNVSGFFGDRQTAAAEMLASTDVDVLTGDWLAELTMLILQKQRDRDPLKGFASTFVDQVEQVLGTCLERGITIVSNAGGINPEGCAEAVQAVADRLGLKVQLGTVNGDDIADRVPDLAAAGSLRRLGEDNFTEQGLPLAANAYLGGWGIAACLDAGADIVVTGRVTDASLVVGPSASAFGWGTSDWDRLAGAVLAGHVIECGAQATGGNYPFFTEIDDMRRLGFPIAEMYPDGSCVITKPEGSNGRVTRDTVTAQLLYEVGSAAYANTDVVALLDSVEITEEGPDRVALRGASGLPAPEELKVSMAYEGGYRNSMTLVLTGLEPEKKAQVALDAIWDIIPGGKESFDDVDVELLGSTSEDPKTLGESVCMLRIAVADTDERRVGRAFSSGIIQTGLASYPGFFMTTPPGGASAFARFVPALVDATAVQEVARLGDRELPVPSPARETVPMPDAYVEPTSSRDWGPTITAPIGAVCGGRSGDKGGNANIGLWTRDDAAFEWLVQSVTVEVMSDLLPSGSDYRIERFVFENLRALNFVVHGWLGDGVASSLRFDGQAKGLAEYIRARHVEIPQKFLSA